MPMVSACTQLDPSSYSAWNALHDPGSSALPDPLEGLTIADSHLEQVLRGKAYLVQDGAIGTQLQAHGLAQGGQIPDLASITDPDVVTLVHREYVDAGAQMVTTNSFGANEIKLKGQASVEEVCSASVACAKQSGARYVAGSIGPLGKLLEPFGDVSFERAFDLFYRQAAALSEAGADVITIETMTDLREAKAAVLAARAACKLPIFASMTYSKYARTLFGSTPEVVAATLSSLGVQAVCVNCSLGPQEIAPIVRELVRASRCPVAVRPNAGMPRLEQGRTVYDITPEEFAQAMDQMLDGGVTIVGGCCGTNPAFIEKLAALVGDRSKPATRAYEPALRVCSSQTVARVDAESGEELEVSPAIDPADSEAIEEVREGDADSVADEAMDAFDDADVVELSFVPAGLSPDEEGALFEEVLAELEETSPMPLLIRANEADVLEHAVRSIAGKPLVGVCSDDLEAFEQLIPVVRRYGCAVIIPGTGEQAKMAVQLANKAGIAGEDMVVGA